MKKRSSSDNLTGFWLIIGCECMSNRGWSCLEPLTVEKVREWEDYIKSESIKAKSPSVKKQRVASKR